MPVLGERFYQMSNTIFCYDLKPIPLAVYSYLVCCAGQKDVCWPSMKTIALHCGCSENAARDAVSLYPRHAGDDAGGSGYDGRCNWESNIKYR